MWPEIVGWKPPVRTCGADDGITGARIHPKTYQAAGLKISPAGVWIGFWNWDPAR